MHPTILTLSLLIMLVAAPAAPAGKMYRWVDAEGNVHYTDKIPADQVDRSHQELSESGIRTGMVPRAKTREEVEEERQLEQLRAEQQRLIEKQEAADRALLRTFRSEDDMMMARDGKLAAIDVMIKITQGSIRRHQAKLADLQHRAATLERTGKAAPQSLVSSIDSTLRNINDAYASIERKEQEKSAVRQTFARDLKRFQELKNLEPEAVETQEEVQEIEALPNLVYCHDPQTCEEAWTRAEAFVRKKATTPMQMLSDMIIMTAAPAKDQDVSITVSLLDNPESGRTALFMDLFCKDTPVGKELCLSDGVSSIRQAFRPEVGGVGTE